MRTKKNILTRLMAGILALTIIASIALIPKKASAAEADTYTEANTGIVYTLDETNYNFKTYWKNKKVPVMDGFVFAGWYTKNGEAYTALTEETAAQVDTAYAKFVPDYVLSVRAQNEDGTAKTDGKGNSIRVLSSVDSTDYQSVGFDIWLANKKQITLNWDGKTPLTTTKIYEKIMVKDSPVGPENYFGGKASKYFSVWRLDNIIDANDGKIIYVRPYWTTLDGTKVEGLAKYIHLEDGYEGYINVPINLMTGEEIAAGVVKIGYSNLELIDVENGRLLTEMKGNYLDGEIRLVCNTDDLTNTVYADGIYANIRFKKSNTNPNDLMFTLKENADFANLNEEAVEITPIIQY